MRCIELAIEHPAAPRRAGAHLQPDDRDAPGASTSPSWWHGSPARRSTLSTTRATRRPRTTCRSTTGSCSSSASSRPRLEEGLLREVTEIAERYATAAIATRSRAARAGRGTGQPQAGRFQQRSRRPTPSRSLAEERREPERRGGRKQHDQRQLIAPAELVDDHAGHEHRQGHRHEAERRRSQPGASGPTHSERREQAGDQADDEHRPRREPEALVVPEPASCAPDRPAPGRRRAPG